MKITGAHLPSVACAVFLTAACSTRPPDSASEEETRPNVLLYVVDALRPDSLGCYGNEEVATPAIDGLAREGVLFENAFAQSSWTRPSITTILTGLYPGAHSVLGRQHRLAQNLTLLPEILRQRGYRTGFITTNPNVGSFFGFDQGWDTLQELYERRDEGHVRSTELITRSDTVTTAAIDWIGQAAQPFFLLILAVDPHWPYQPPERFDRYARAAPGDRERMRGLYHGEVAANDDSFGKLLAHLRDRKLYDDMVIVFTSDHGEEFWEHDERGHGKALYEESIRIPLVIRAPSFGEGQRIDRPVQSVDIMPTLLTLAGLPIPSPMDGQPIPMTATEATPVFSRLLHDNQNLAAIRDYPWKLIWNRETDEKQLFNLAEDPAELTPVTNQNGEMERLAHRLFQHAAQNLARRESLNKNVDPETVSEETIPDNVRETLKALGYVQ